MISKTNPFYYSVGTRVRENIFQNMLKPSPENNILDVGCGLGYFTNMLSSNGTICTGIDLDKECIDYCQENMRGKYQVADVTKLPFLDNSFDKVLCTEVLEHIQENGVVLDEIVRVTQNHSIVVVSTPCSNGIFKGLFKRIGHSNIENNSREFHHHKGYTEKSLGELLIRHNILPVETYYTLVALTEIYMAVTKIIIQVMMKSKISSQANALNVLDTRIWKIHKWSFPAIIAMVNAEQPLSGKLKGHMIIMKGVVNK